jgi:hypothetical protein
MPSAEIEAHTRDFIVDVVVSVGMMMMTVIVVMMMMAVVCG